MTKCCATCRYWSDKGDGVRVFSNGDDDYRETEHRRCLAVMHGNGCSAPYSVISGKAAIVTDGSGYSAALRTLPGFSCSLYEER